MKLIGKKLLLKPFNKETVSATGIIIPSNNKSNRFKIVSVGEELIHVTDKKTDTKSKDAKEIFGENVLTNHKGIPVNINGEEHYINNLDSVLIFFDDNENVL